MAEKQAEAGKLPTPPSQPSSPTRVETDPTTTDPGRFPDSGPARPGSGTSPTGAPASESPTAEQLGVPKNEIEQSQQEKEKSVQPMSPEDMRNREEPKSLLRSDTSEDTEGDVGGYR